MLSCVDSSDLFGQPPVLMRLAINSWWTSDSVFFPTGLCASTVIPQRKHQLIGNDVPVNRVQRSASRRLAQSCSCSRIKRSRIPLARKTWGCKQYSKYYWSMPQPEQWARVHRFSGPYPGETVHAHYVQHRFARHAHEHLVIGLVERGVQQYTYQGSRYRTCPGQIFFVDGGEPHTGEAANEDGYVYRTLCLNPRVLVGIAREVTDREELPHFCNAVITDRLLFTKLLGLHRAVGSGASTM